MPIIITEELVESLSERVFHYFREISKIPRGSGDEKAIADYLAAFGAEHGLAVRRSDAVFNGKQTYNVVLCKNASKGYGRADTVVLQAHTDMVCQKTKDSAHNFKTDPIKIIVEGDTMRADGTTLGADDGIGAAIILAILESDTVAHPQIEALFTSDEEEGMTGAMALEGSFITGKLLLINIDAEEEGALYCGCAGGVSAHFYLPVTKEPVPNGYSCVKIELSGLLGGHSGLEIHKKRANANKLMARVLSAMSQAFPMRLIAFNGGGRRNVIPLQFEDAQNAAKAIALVEALKETFASDYEGIEPSISLRANEALEPHPAEALSVDSAAKLLLAVMLMPDGIITMHDQVAGLVGTSSNLGVVNQENSRFELLSLVRSFSKSEKEAVLFVMSELAKGLGAEFFAEGDYPDWKPNPASGLIARFKRAYAEAFGNEPRLESVHAGLECAYFAEKYPDMDMIALGPTITGAHSTAETLHIQSTKKVIKLLLSALSQMNPTS